MLAHIGHGQEGGHGIDVQGREADGELLFEVADQDVQIPLLPGPAEQLPQAVDAHALGPFPVLVEADIVAGQVPALHIFQEDVIILVKDGAKCFDQQRELPLGLRS